MPNCLKFIDEARQRAGYSRNAAFLYAFFQWCDATHRDIVFYTDDHFQTAINQFVNQRENHSNVR